MDQSENPRGNSRLDIAEWNLAAREWFVRAAHDHTAAGEIDLLQLCRLLLDNAPDTIREKLPALGPKDAFDRMLLADAAANAAMLLWDRDTCGYMLSRNPGGRVIGSVWIAGESNETSFDARSEGVALAGALLMAIKKACALEGWPDSQPLRVVDP